MSAEHLLVPSSKVRHGGTNCMGPALDEPFARVVLLLWLRRRIADDAEARGKEPGVPNDAQLEFVLSFSLTTVALPLTVVFATDAISRRKRCWIMTGVSLLIYVPLIITSQ
ncbi:hypothetical protein B0H19DRAFT_1252988 [Mycena capillaripes]|nr:hypothetical protein B0H19DRAFT_1252988 [Mycena capillaripes]